MVSKCIIDTCNTVKAGDGVTLHKLPSNGQVQQEWFRAILNETGQTVFSEDDVICSKHFASDCFTTIDGKILLNPSSVPFESLKKTEPEPKRLKRDKGITNQTQCSVFSCAHSLATTATLKPQLIYHPFPKKKDLVEKWKQFCNKEDDDDFEKCYVCSDHFTDNDYVTKRGSGRLKTLKSEATPTIYKKELSIEEQSELDSSNVSMEATNELEGDGSASNPSGDIETDETANCGFNNKSDKSDSIRKRVRNRPNKKWMEKEVIELLEYLTEHKDFEKPTARIYYKKFLEKNEIEVTWDLVKWKVRNLRTVYKKAKDWLNSASAEVLKETNDAYVKDIIKRMCPHFEQLDVIFCEKLNKIPKVFDTIEYDTMETDESIIPQSFLTTTLISESTQDTTFTNNREIETQVFSKIPSSSAPHSNKKTKDFHFKTGVQQLPSPHIVKIEYQNSKMEFARERFAKKLELKERKFQFEKEKVLRELELKSRALELQKIGIEKNERLKRLEMKKNERIAMKELELKYKGLSNDTQH